VLVGARRWRARPELDMQMRRSIRKQGYDYSQPAHYFITLCTARGECLFGEIINGQMLLNRAGLIVQQEWMKTAEIRKNVRLDAFIVMPNHLHGILIIKEEESYSSLGKHARRTHLGTILGQFKSIVTKKINADRRNNQAVWQRNYYDRIIRDERELKVVQLYIETNPLFWNMDVENDFRKFSDDDLLARFRSEFQLNDDSLELLMRYVTYRKDRFK
jgi:putative transposase